MLSKKRASYGNLAANNLHHVALSEGMVGRYELKKRLSA